MRTIIGEKNKGEENVEEVMIRKAQSGDEKDFAYIQVQSWISAFSSILPVETMQRMTNLKRLEGMYARNIQNADTELYLQLVHHKAHGIAGWSKERSGALDRTAELICIHSLPDKRRCGYGSALIDAVLQDIKACRCYDQVVLWVFEENHTARKFYERHGFEATEERKDSFGASELMYRKRIE